MSQTIANMEDPSFFEGVEKLLEVWFVRKDGRTQNCDLRKIPRSGLELIMNVVKCEIISATSSDELDSYVLSESSMFVSSNRFILKTCGTTTPLLGLPTLVSLVSEYTGFDTVQDLFYSRKQFKKPELQVKPHRSFDEERSLLEEFFPDGRGYCMGRLNDKDCWYMYTASPGRSVYKDHVIRPNPHHHRGSRLLVEPDQTLEILMTNVSEEKMKTFYKENTNDAKEATKKSGIDKFISGMTIDDYLFEPCGYSMNGVSRLIKGGYMTIHITPEPAFSYVSFETNIPQVSYKDLIDRVITAFEPQEFVVTFFSSEDGKVRLNGDENGVPIYPDYDVKDMQVCYLSGYDVTYALYNRFPS